MSNMKIQIRDQLHKSNSRHPDEERESLPFIDIINHCTGWQSAAPTPPPWKLKQLQTVQTYWFHFWLWYSLINYTAQDSWTVKTTCTHHFRNMVKKTKRWKIPKTDGVGGVEAWRMCFHRHDQLMHLPAGSTHPLLFRCVSISRIISIITNFIGPPTSYFLHALASLGSYR